MVKGDAVGNRQHSKPNTRPRVPRNSQPHHNLRGCTGPRPMRPVVVDDGTIPAAFVSPFQASQRQAGHHSAAVVRASVSGPSQEKTLFYSSVQCRGGVFTKTEQETRAQLARTGVLPNSIQYRKRARLAEEERTGKPQTVEGRFANMQSEKVQEDVRQAKELAKKKSNANRFTLEESDSGGDES